MVARPTYGNPGLGGRGGGRGDGKPYYRRNKTRVCTFWLCNRCDRVTRQDCPYRPCNGDFDFPELDKFPELKTKARDWLNDEGAVACMTRDDAAMKEVRAAIGGRLGGNITENIQKRYYGKGDELTDSKLAKMSAGAEPRNDPPLQVPADQTITTLFVGGVPTEVSEDDLRQAFAGHGDVANVHVKHDKQVAFVSFRTRQGAEAAALALHNNLNVKGFIMRLDWGKARGPPRGAAPQLMGGRAPAPQHMMPQQQGGAMQMQYGAMPMYAGAPMMAPGMMAMPPPAAGGWVLPPPSGPPPVANLPPQMGAPTGPPPAVHYASQDPSAMGAPLGAPKTAPPVAK